MGAQRPVRISALLAFLALAMSLGAEPVAQAAPDEHQREDHDEARRGEHRDAGHDRRRGHDRVPEYRYAQPVYAPPAEYYQPPQSPGVTLFLPFDLRR